MSSKPDPKILHQIPRFFTRSQGFFKSPGIFPQQAFRPQREISASRSQGFSKTLGSLSPFTCAQIHGFGNTRDILELVT